MSSAGAGALGCRQNPGKQTTPCPRSSQRRSRWREANGKLTCAGRWASWNGPRPWWTCWPWLWPPPVPGLTGTLEVAAWGL
eukprot:9696589-Lingulodinium_polyedra.AAC.1